MHDTEGVIQENNPSLVPYFLGNQDRAIVAYYNKGGSIMPRSRSKSMVWSPGAPASSNPIVKLHR